MVSYKNLIVFTLLFPIFLGAQSVAKSGVLTTTKLEGFVRDAVSGAPIQQSKVYAYDEVMKTLLAETQTDATGFYTVAVPAAAQYKVSADKPTFFEAEAVLKAGQRNADLRLDRKPGYVFDITIFDKAFEHNPINTLRDCKVEIYNNTTKEQELTVEKLRKSTFNFSFAEGNHYTVLVRKPGYLNRRIEVYVNVNGCILCVDGMGVKEPDLVPLMTNRNETGFFLGAIDLDSIQVGKRFQLNNIYYDFNKWAIRPEAAKNLDKLATFLKDNPSVKIELGSHTDARGADLYNLTLSDKRAEAAVDYLVSTHGIDRDMVTFKGYGETQLINRCDDGISCPENDHQMNRRTEIKITGISDKDPLWEKSLKQIIEDPELYRKVIQQEKGSKMFTTAPKTHLKK
jgi:outer membrane protein OmpA-like peptidoglycan-associated protein